MCVSKRLGEKVFNAEFTHVRSTAVVTGERHQLPGLAVSASLRGNWKWNTGAVKPALKGYYGNGPVTNPCTFSTQAQQDIYIWWGGHRKLKSAKRLEEMQIFDIFDCLLRLMGASLCMWRQQCAAEERDIYNGRTELSTAALILSGAHLSVRKRLRQSVAVHK